MSEQLPLWVKEATEPSSIEVQRLQARLREQSATPAGSRPGWLMIPAIAVTLLLAVALWPAGYGAAPDAGAALAFGDEAVLLGPSIVLHGDGLGELVRAGTEGTVVRLTEGTFLAEVDPEGRHRAFTVLAPGDVAVSVVGTRFSVSWSDESGGDVSVERGQVTVSGPDGERSLGAGESWRWIGDAAAGEAALERPVPGADDGAPGLSSGGDRHSGDDGDVARPPSEPEPSSQARVQPIEAPPAAKSSAPQPPEDASNEDGPVAAIPAGSVAVPPTTESPEGTGSDQEINRARAFGRVQTSMENGAYTDAVDLARRFQTRWPGGVLGAEAQVLEIEALSYIDPAASVTVATEWLGIHEQHTRRLEVLRIHASVANDRLGDCALAMPSYAELTTLESGVEQAKALGFYALCAQQTGHEGAQRSIDAALDHPDLPRSLTPRLRAARKRLPPETLR